MTRGHWSALLAIFLAPCASAYAADQFVPRDDFQIWTEVLASHSLRERADLLLGGSLRLGRDAQHLVYGVLSASVHDLN